MGDFKDVEIIEVLVKEGQSIKKNDSLHIRSKAINLVLKCLPHMEGGHRKNKCKDR